MSISHRPHFPEREGRAGWGCSASSTLDVNQSADITLFVAGRIHCDFHGVFNQGPVMWGPSASLGLRL